MSDTNGAGAGLAKTYEPQAIEDAMYAGWKASGVFHDEPDPNREPYCITIPPPNITGSLHMGHALNNTILDMMVRWHRMRGFCAICIPGTDHAGIATQNVVEKELLKEGVSREQIGREAFVERCWKWREQYGTRIYHQFEKLGCSYDWQRVRFTLDETYVSAIHEEFRRWYERGLIYRGTRVVNWDVHYQSAISDIEVQMETRAGSLYHFRYPFADGNGFVIIATTRPETMLGDTAVAANPDDERYQPHFGRLLRVPLTDREVPLIADTYARPEFGTGAVKVTPAHDLDDYECGQRNTLPTITVIGKDGRMTADAGAEFAGLDRFEARERVVARMEEAGLLEKIEDYSLTVPISERSGQIVEPLLSEQWFVDMRPLAEPAIEAVRDGKIRFIPERHRAIYLHWMENIRDWCISRQLWWGHRIPVWWAEENGQARHAFALSRAEAVAALGTEEVWQDPDVLDTWFSSALWPHAVLGWPERTADLDYFFPTNLLSTAQEILYLWVARMVMTGLDFVRRPLEASPAADGIPAGAERAIIPFRDVYIHATVLDKQGRRMSKSLRNGVDPLDLVERYGADATRLSLMQQAGKNQDIKYSEQRTEHARAFCTKLWNASRFVLGHLADYSPSGRPEMSRLSLADRWILSRLDETVEATDAGLRSYDIDDAVRALYAFFWNDFCDGYIEIAKADLRGESERRLSAQSVLFEVLETLLRLLHPIMPFITETIWLQLPHVRETICRAPYPVPDEGRRDPEASTEMERIFEAIRAARNLRAEMAIAPGSTLAGAVAVGRAPADPLPWISTLETLARLSPVSFVGSSAEAGEGRWVGAPFAGGEILIRAESGVDPAKEAERLDTEIAAVEAEIGRCRKKLDNPSFVARANPAVVEEERRRLEAWSEQLERLTARRAGLAPGG